MKKIILPIILILLSLVYTNAQIISIGVEPAEINLNEKTAIDFRFFNPNGDTDAIYKLNPDSCLSGLILDDNDCWDITKTFEVPKGTNMDNYIEKTLCFDKPTSNQVCYLYVEGTPKGYQSSGTVKLNTRIGIKFNLLSVTTTTIKPTIKTTTAKSSNLVSNKALNKLYEETTTTLIQTTTTTQEELILNNVEKEETVTKMTFDKNFLIGIGTVASFLCFIVAIFFKISIDKKGESHKEDYIMKSVTLFLILTNIPLCLANDINVSVDVLPTTTTTTIAPKPQPYTALFSEVGSGIGSLLSEKFGSSIAIFLILIALGTSIGYIMTSISRKIGIESKRD